MVLGGRSHRKGRALQDIGAAAPTYEGGRNGTESTARSPLFLCTFPLFSLHHLSIFTVPSITSLSTSHSVSVIPSLINSRIKVEKVKRDCYIS